MTALLNSLTTGQILKLINMSLTDWKGNEIKSGDTLVIVKTKPLAKSAGILYKGQYHEIEKYPEHIWSVSEEMKVMGSDNYLMVQEYADGITVLSSLHGLIWLLEGSSTIICIKGVSDNEQEYYSEYFK